MKKKNIVLSLGGSLINPEDIDIDFLKKFKSLILKNLDKHKFFIICGGGNTARKYVSALDKLGISSNEIKDWIGISGTKINSELVLRMFGKKAHEKIIDNPLSKINTDKDIIIASGWKPGFSSDMDAVLIAKNITADKVINLSNIDYVYNKDPKLGDAKKYNDLKWDEYLELISNEWSPGLSTPFDPIASKEAKNSEKTVFILGSDLDNLQSCLDNKEFNGTILHK